MSKENLKKFKSPKVREKGNEPWVVLPNSHDQADWTQDDQISYNQRLRQKAKYEFFQNTMDFITDNRIFGDYYEFGCHKGRTFRMVLTEARRHNLDKMNFFAFDSFEGLPEPTSDTSVEIWKKGALTTTEQSFKEMITEHGVYTGNIKTVKGYYDDSLTCELQASMMRSGTKAALVNVDCDLFESAVPVFDFIEPLLQEGTVLYIDDLFAGYKGNPMKGVCRAFLNWQSKSKWKLMPHLQIGWWGRSYITYADESLPVGVL